MPDVAVEARDYRMSIHAHDGAFGRAHDGYIEGPAGLCDNCGIVATWLDWLGE